MGMSVLQKNLKEDPMDQILPMGQSLPVLIVYYFIFSHFWDPIF